MDPLSPAPHAVEVLPVAAASPFAAPILSELARARLEASLWKSRALELLSRESRLVASRKGFEASEALAAFKALAVSFGVDSSRAFEWDDSGRVIYLSESSEKP